MYIAQQAFQASEVIHDYPDLAKFVQIVIILLLSTSYLVSISISLVSVNALEKAASDCITPVNRVHIQLTKFQLQTAQHAFVALNGQYVEFGITPFL